MVPFRGKRRPVTPSRAGRLFNDEQPFDGSRIDVSRSACSQRQNFAATRPHIIPLVWGRTAVGGYPATGRFSFALVF